STRSAGSSGTASAGNSPRSATPTPSPPHSRGSSPTPGSAPTSAPAVSRRSGSTTGPSSPTGSCVCTRPSAARGRRSVSVELIVLVVVVLVAALAALFTAYLTAHRLDRLHIRTDLARAALTGALERRHTVAAAVA